MADLKGSKTEANLQAAFAGESQARGKYFYFAAKAREEGFNKVARIFEETGNNETEHAKIWFKYLGGIGSTAANIQTAADGEHYESSEMYVQFAKTAKEEGFSDIAKHFEQIAKIEKGHEDRFLKLGKTLIKDSEEAASWECVNCGNIISAKRAPGVCPVCAYADIAWSGATAYKKVED